ncbi:hypothetical protein FOWG_05899 [Fusarium oxysporum f. sp. lycopersici MN25]|uniref:Uncharacterized protein n=1 Tax=Fusarium oxysporum Fo47 TaxID=660027 RepID=W9KYS8_FUSOX|nr:hypothetical protein FOZG_03661 [Fusarium oxysporum Fo47]EWZ92959.1 hypothetical protein FOWG_05899 [Fusarium oxysporum f. sp. lycopersici MN25]
MHSAKQNGQFRYHLEYSHCRSEFRSGLLGSIFHITRMQYDISSLLLNSGYKTLFVNPVMEHLRYIISSTGVDSSLLSLIALWSDILFKPCTELQYPNSYKNCHSFVSWNHAAHTELPDEDGPCCEVDGGFKHCIATYCLHPGPPATPFRAPVIARRNRQLDVMKPPAVNHSNQKH